MDQLSDNQTIRDLESENREQRHQIKRLEDELREERRKNEELRRACLARLEEQRKANT